MLVIGGNIAQSYSLFEDSLQDFLMRKHIDMQVAVSELGETASFIGSARLMDDAFYTNVYPLLKKM